MLHYLILKNLLNILIKRDSHNALQCKIVNYFLKLSSTAGRVIYTEAKSIPGALKRDIYIYPYSLLMHDTSLVRAAPATTGRPPYFSITNAIKKFDSALFRAKNFDERTNSLDGRK